MKKKLITSLMFVVMALAFSICLISCGSAKVNGIYVKEGTYETKVDHKSNVKSLDVLSMAEIYAKLSNGTERQVSLDDVEVSDLNTNTVGTTTIELSYAGFTCTIDVEVVKTIVKIEPTVELKSTYKQNEAFGDIALKVTYSDNTTETISEGFDVSGSTKNVGVNKELKISYKGKEFTRTFNVEHFVDSFEITNFAPSVFYGDDYDYSSIAIRVKYSDALEETINYNANNFIIKINTNKTGKQTLQVTYAEITNEKEIEVLAKLSSIEYVSGLGTEMEGSAFKVSSYNQIKAIKMKAKFNDNSEKEITFEDLTEENIDYNKKGSSQTVCLKYVENGITQSCNIEIFLTEGYTAEGQKVISKIEIAEGAIENLIHGRTVSTPKIMATYDDNSTEDVSAKVSIKRDDDYNKVPAGQNSFNSLITYKFRGQEVTMNFVVWNLPSEIELVDLKTELNYGDTFTYPGVKVYFLNGDVKETTAGELEGLTLNSKVYDTVVGSHYLKYTYITSYKTPYKDNQELNYINESLEEREFSISKQVIVTIKDVSLGLEIVGLGDDANTYSVVQGKSLNFDSIEVFEKFKSGNKVRLYKGVDYSVSALDTTTLGEKTITFTKIGDDSITKDVQIQVISGYTITSFTAPSFVNDYNTNKVKENTYNETGSSGIKGFTETNKAYTVGSSNPFIFAPIMLAKPNGEEKSVIVSDYSIRAKVYIKSGADYSECTTNLADYVSIDLSKKSFQFTELANGKEFKIEVTPENSSSVSPVSFEFKVVSGYNVYNADDLSVVDNTNMENKWDSLKQVNGIASDLNVNTVILHNNISIRKENLPEIHFYKKGDVVNNIALNENDIDYDRALGSLKDSGTSKGPLGAIYTRTLKPGETFTMEGNYFTISIQDMPLIVRGDGKVSETLDKAITTHTTLFRFIPEENQDGTFIGEHATANINNVAFYGNSKKSEIPALSGGMMCMKVDSTNLNVLNCLSQAWFIGFMVEGNNSYSDDVQAKFYKTNAYDAYNTLLYVWGGRNVALEECKFIGAGGPVMIVDHVDNDKNTGEGGYISNVTNKNSILESWVEGTEGWFVTYGATAVVGSLKAIDQILLATCNSAGVSFYKSILDPTGSKLNLVAVYKSGDTEGMSTSIIRGSFKEVVSEDELKAILEFSENINAIKQSVMSQIVSNVGPEKAKDILAQMAIIQTDSNAIGVPSDTGWLYPNNSGLADFVEKLMQTQKYLSLYLFNGMGAILGVENKTISA